MKHAFLSILIISPFFAISQASQADSIAIRQACDNYVGGFYHADTARVAKGIHPELTKKIVNKRAGDVLQSMPAPDLIKAAGNFKPRDPNPAEPFKLDVFIYDIASDIATAKIVTNKMPFFDYVQLGKVQGEWKVINVLWAFNK